MVQVIAMYHIKLEPHYIYITYQVWYKLYECTTFVHHCIYFLNAVQVEGKERLNKLLIEYKNTEYK